MTVYLVANGASTALASDIDAVTTTISVQAATGGVFPSPGVDEVFALVLEDTAGNVEICHCTSRTGDALTVVRGQENTTAKAFTAANTVAENRITKALIDSCLRNDGGVLAGPLTTAGYPLQGAAGDTDTELSIPNDGSHPTIGGNKILLDGMQIPVGGIIMWSGDVAPAGWNLCDGTNGTPDLRDKFILGSGGSELVGGTGGSTAKTTSSDNEHSHGGTTAGHQLTIAEMPSHTHEVLSDGVEGGGGDIGLGPDTHRGIFTQPAGGNQPHAHGINTTPAHSHSISDARPPYYALAFIQRAAYTWLD